MFKYPFIQYLKVMYEIDVFENKHVGIKVGTHITYNFDIEYANMGSKTFYKNKYDLTVLQNINHDYFKKYSFSSLEAAISIGMTIGGFNPKRYILAILYITTK